MILIKRWIFFPDVELNNPYVFYVNFQKHAEFNEKIKD